MAVIKCSNCENEILDTDIVCPYCDCPVRGTKDKAEAQKAAAPVSDETMKVGSVKDAVKEASKAESADVKAEAAPSREAENADAVQNNPAAAEDAPADDSQDKTMKVPAEDLQSETLRRSLEERRAARAQERKLQKKRKDHKIAIITLTVIGIFVIIYLLTNVISNILGEGIFDKEKENKKAEKVVTSEAEMADLGFKFHSHTLTILDQSVLMDDYEANSEKPWKEYSTDTSNLTIASGIETIGAYSFDDLINLTHVTIASSVSSIGESAFYGCSELEELALDSDKSKLASIGNYAFTDCSSLKKVTLGNKLKKIGEGAFKSCDSLEEIAIPASVTEIGADAFLGCPDLVIICEKDSYAYEYATENGITVELSDEEEEIEEEVSVDDVVTYPDSSTTTTPKNDTKKTDTKKTDSKSDTSSTTGTKKDSSSSSSTTTSQNNSSGNSNTSSSTGNTNSQTGTTTPSQGSDTSGGSTNLETLIGDLNKATTQAEKDQILEQIDKVVGEN